MEDRSWTLATVGGANCPRGPWGNQNGHQTNASRPDRPGPPVSDNSRRHCGAHTCSLDRVLGLWACQGNAVVVAYAHRHDRGGYGNAEPNGCADADRGTNSDVDRGTNSDAQAHAHAHSDAQAHAHAQPQTGHDRGG